jgi:Kinesin-associated protein (KAP)
MSSVTLQSCIDQLYESEEDRLQAVKHILDFAQEDPEPVLSVIPILVRILSEESKNLTDLPVSICCCLSVIARDTSTHQFLKENKCGDVVFKLLETELNKRSLIFEESLKTLTLEFHATRKPSIVESLNMEITKIDKSSKLMNIILMFLFQLGADRLVEKKMVNRGIIQYLFQILTKKDSLYVYNPLQETVLTFLLRLSVIKDYKDVMITDSRNISLIFDFLRPISVSSMVHVGACNLAKIALQLIFNLSFDSKCRETMKKLDSLKFLCDCLRVSELKDLAINVFVVLTEDPQVCENLIGELAPVLMQITNSVGAVTDELAAVLCNVSAVKPDAIVDSAVIHEIFEHTVIAKDVKLMKMFKIVTQTQSQRLVDSVLKKKIDSKWVEDILTSDKVDFNVEVLGFIANMHPGFDWGAASKGNLLKFVMSAIRVKDEIERSAEIRLEAVMAVSAMCTSPPGTFQLPDFVPEILRIFNSTEDEDTETQALYSLNRLIVDAGCIIPSDRYLPKLKKLADSPYAIVRNQVESMLDIDSDNPGFIEIREIIKDRKFKALHKNLDDYGRPDINQGDDEEDDYEDGNNDFNSSSFNWRGINFDINYSYVVFDTNFHVFD